MREHLPNAFHGRVLEVDLRTAEDWGLIRGTRSGGETVRLSLSFFYSYCPPQMLNPKTPPDLERIIYRCITVPSYGLQELRQDLEGFIAKA